VSTVTLWRLSPAFRVERALGGDGAFRRGGRWNSPGTRVVYCAESRSLAAMEVLANVRAAPLLFEQNWVMIPITVPTAGIEIPARVPASWRAIPYPGETQLFGSEWVRAGRSVALRVPSVVVLGEFNYLLNPAHPDFGKITVGKAETFSFDPRFRA
jgi:RES domain-containing protein